MSYNTFNPAAGVHALTHKGLKPCWFVGIGVVLIVLGALCLADTGATTLASMMALGVLVMLGGLAQIVQGVVHPGSAGASKWLPIVIGAVMILAGFMIVEEPEAGSFLLTAVLAGCLIIAGIVRIYWATAHRLVPMWWLGLVSGIVSLLIGIFLYLSLPWSGLFFLGTVIAIELLFTGISSLLFGLSLRKTLR